MTKEKHDMNKTTTMVLGQSWARVLVIPLVGTFQYTPLMVIVPQVLLTGF